MERYTGILDIATHLAKEFAPRIPKFRAFRRFIGCVYNKQQHATEALSNSKFTIMRDLQDLTVVFSVLEQGFESIKHRPESSRRNLQHFGRPNYRLKLKPLGDMK